VTHFTDQTRATIERLRRRDHDRIGELGRSNLLLHEQVRPLAVVLFHGMAASPAQFVRFAHELHEHGHNVIVPRLPRHGHVNRLSTALAYLTASDLRDFVRDNVELAGGLGERVVVAGFSLGGLLATWAAQKLQIERAVAIAPFFGVSWLPGRFMAGFARLLLTMPNQFHWWNPILRENQLPIHGYPRYSTHAVAQSYLLAREISDHAHRGLCARELIFVTNQRETAVNNRAVWRVERRMRAGGAEALHHVVLSGIPFSHDIIEPQRHPAIAERVFPTLLGLIEGGHGWRAANPS
jgi:alpha-beta hydrolase superfamily lysophospholipase